MQMTIAEQVLRAERAEKSTNKEKVSPCAPDLCTKHVSRSVCISPGDHREDTCGERHAPVTTRAGWKYADARHFSLDVRVINYMSFSTLS
jgi:hypothetical protein